MHKPNKRSFADLFSAMFQNKYKLEDFINSTAKEKCIHFQENEKIIFKVMENYKDFYNFINLIIFQRLPIAEDAVFSYRRGVQISDAVKRHSGNKYFFQTDIVSFFKSINRSLIKNTLEAARDEIPLLDIKDYEDRIIDQVCIDDELPIGLPTSSAISNSALMKFDIAILEHCKIFNLTYTRYSDDIIISSMVKSKLDGICDLVQNVLHTHASPALNINKGKTKFFQIGGRVKILGLTLLPTGKVTIDNKLKKIIEVLLHFYKTDNEKFSKAINDLFPNKNKTSSKKSLDRLSGYLNYVNSIDQDYLDKLRSKFGASIVDSLLYRPLSDSK